MAQTDIRTNDTKASPLPYLEYLSTSDDSSPTPVLPENVRCSSLYGSVDHANKDAKSKTSISNATAAFFAEPISGAPRQVPKRTSSVQSKADTRWLDQEMAQHVGKI